MGKLGIYLLANYPTREIFLEAVRTCDAQGVDFLEVGFPFSDPIADGAFLERASFDVLKRYGLADSIRSFRDARQIFRERTYVMTYTNLLYRQGAAEFVKSLGSVNGLILADLPLRETPFFEKQLRGSAVSLINFLTPESRDRDITLALRNARDFIYFVSKRGITGGGFDLDEETRNKIARVRGKGPDVYLGFGIRDRRDFDLACGAADGAIVGTKAVSELEQGIDAFSAFLKSLRS